LGIHFTVGICCESTATLAQKKKKKKKIRCAAPITEKYDKPAFFSASGAALSQEVPTVK
jgi:hypothetical protein